jgi:hypothetical protein
MRQPLQHLVTEVTAVRKPALQSEESLSFDEWCYRLKKMFRSNPAMVSLILLQGHLSIRSVVRIGVSQSRSRELKTFVVE